MNEQVIEYLQGKLVEASGRGQIALNTAIEDGTPEEQLVALETEIRDIENAIQRTIAYLGGN